ncbi:hypothetical protein AAA799P11_01438 [Marine Group I thaumarchaeote SCGC AAA799-P11]|uniref:Uncharacterized protein n=1 Tax=Marine Group I thaumarchaeote SCGC AAA799-P11 TaxID=1502295 RepID=A0A087RSC1_9ARCH|nr:hypothetical protein AAA799P11_01438 [Marine Group I thaumarchaeote SCGC AAA799-P11]
MTDIIWGNGANVLSNDIFVLNVTHRKNGNKEDYSDTEKIKISKADIPGLPHARADWSEDTLKSCIKDAFLKCEIEQREDSGILSAKVSHSGVGGY